MLVAAPRSLGRGDRARRAAPRAGRRRARRARSRRRSRPCGRRRRRPRTSSATSSRACTPARRSPPCSTSSRPGGRTSSCARRWSSPRRWRRSGTACRRRASACTSRRPSTATRGRSALAAGPLGALRPLAGLAPDPELRAIRDSPLLTLAPAATDVPGAPPALRFRDPEAAGPGARNGGPPLVYVAFGSEAPALAALPRRVPRRARGAGRRSTCRCSPPSATGATRPSSARSRRTRAWSGGCRRPRSCARRPRWSATAARARRSPRSPRACRRRSCRSSSTGRRTPRGSRSSARGSRSTGRPPCAAALAPAVRRVLEEPGAPRRRPGGRGRDRRAPAGRRRGRRPSVLVGVERLGGRHRHADRVQPVQDPDAALVMGEDVLEPLVGRGRLVGGAAAQLDAPSPPARRGRSGSRSRPR